MADTDTITPDAPADELTLDLPSLDDYIANKRYPDDGDVPSELRPKRKYTSRKKQRAAVETISQSLAMLNGMFAMIVPCACTDTLPDELRGIAHRDTCPKMMPLNEDETAALSAAIAAEFEAHPEWVDKLEHADTWLAHAALGAALFGIVMSRRMRTGVILLPDGAAVPEAIDTERPQTVTNGAFNVKGYAFANEVAAT